MLVGALLFYAAVAAAAWPGVLRDYPRMNEHARSLGKPGQPKKILLAAGVATIAGATYAAIWSAANHHTKTVVASLVLAALNTGFLAALLRKPKD